MQKVRIGNDIRLNLTLRGPKNFDEKSIKELRCYFINTSVTKCFGSGCVESCCRKRYPWDNFPHRHCASSYMTDTCGKPGYHTYPHCYWEHECMPCHHHTKYPQSPCDPAHGMGPLPPKYDCDCHHYCRYGSHNPMSRCYDKWDSRKFGHCFYTPGHDELVSPHLDEDFRYLAPSKVLSGKNRIQTYFPAADQFMCGTYKLVVVMVAYEAGWGRCDLHTYTIDYGQVLTLVDDESGLSGQVTIDVDTDTTEGNDITGIQSSRDTYYMLPFTTLSVGEYDYYDKQYRLYVTLANGGQVEFDPEDWDYTNIKFESADPNVVSVDPNTGKLTVGDVAATQTVGITMYADDVVYSFDVKVFGSGYDYVGFANTEDVNLVKNLLNNAYNFPIKTRSVYGTHNLTTPSEESYLWIASRTPIADMNSIENYAHVRISTFDAVLELKGTPAGEDVHYYYYCPTKLMSNVSFDITIDEK